MVLRAVGVYSRTVSRCMHCVWYPLGHLDDHMVCSYIIQSRVGAGGGGDVFCLSILSCFHVLLHLLPFFKLWFVMLKLLKVYTIFCKHLLFLFRLVCLSVYWCFSFWCWVVCLKLHGGRYKEWHSVKQTMCEGGQTLHKADSSKIQCGPIYKRCDCWRRIIF